mmetsp:Transcript_14461/g.45967  ORF Transcript_14461/g.45967 Transcript_14461/m.45967 type:complete len:238 (+) Transcript_14461:1540-2253(+)
MRATAESALMAVVRTSRYDRRLIVPAETEAPGPLATGRDSPVRMASSMEDAPLTTSPSIGMLCPGLTATTEPTGTMSTATSSPVSASTAVEGRRDRTAAMASRALLTERDSSHSEMAKRNTTAPASRYSAMAMAPATAITMRVLMSRMRCLIAAHDLRRMGGMPTATPARATHLRCSSAPPAYERMEMARKSPERRTLQGRGWGRMASRPAPSLRLAPRRASLSEATNTPGTVTAGL